VPDELDLLVVAIDEDEMPLRFGNCQRQAGKSGAGTDVEHTLTLEERPRNETVEQVPGDHLLATPNGCEINLLIPPFELTEQRRELLRDTGRKFLL
jgi:hypothetical protein